MRRKNQLITTQSGNALIYVLIAIVLFAGLSFTMSRQTGDTNTNEVDEAKSELIAVQLIAYATQVKSVIDQLIFTGTRFGSLDLTEPDEAGFGTGPFVHKVFHPEGGGLTPSSIPAQAKADPATDWFIGQVNNVEWTNSAGTDVILTAHQITKSVCEAINETLIGSTTIPALTGPLESYLVETGTNLELTNAVCAACEGHMSLCVSNPGATDFSFYSVVGDR